MNLIAIAKSRAAWIAALGALGFQVPAHAGLCTLTDTGTVMTNANPKPSTTPPPSTCLVNGLPGVGSDLPGYIQAPGATPRSVAIVVSGTTVGTLYDRVYCKGSGSTCDATNTYIIATRVQMTGSGSTCPLWNGAAAGCFEVNDVFRATRSSVGAEVGYWMGASSGSSPEAPVALKYLERTGRTLSGLNQEASPTRNNARVDFRVDANYIDPDGSNAPWSPWLMVKQTCSSLITTNLTTNATTKFAVRIRQGGEEGQSQTYVEQAGYACTP